MSSERSTVPDLRERLLRDGSLKLNLRVIPGSHAPAIGEFMGDGTLKVRVTAAPEKGEANQEVCELLAGYLRVPKQAVEIVHGHRSRNKSVRIRS